MAAVKADTLPSMRAECTALILEGLRVSQQSFEDRELTAGHV